MKFGLLGILQLPRPWKPDSEHKLIQEREDSYISEKIDPGKEFTAFPRFEAQRTA